MFDEDRFRHLWEERPFRMLGSFPLENWRTNRDEVLLERQQRRDEKESTFNTTYNIEGNDTCEGGPLEKAEYLQLSAICVGEHAQQKFSLHNFVMIIVMTIIRFL